MKPEKNVLISKIIALLAKTEKAGCTKAEAAAAAEMAARLMAQYEIDVADLVDQDDIKLMSDEFANNMCWHFLLAEMIGGSVAKFTGTAVYVSNDGYRSRRKQLNFYGRAIDVEFAKHLMAALSDFVIGGAVMEERGKRFTSAKARNAFRKSYLIGAGRRIAERLKAFTEQCAASGSGALVLSRTGEARRFMEQKLRQRGLRLAPTTSISYRLDQEAMNRGAVRGDAANFNRPIEQRAPTALIGGGR